MALVKRTLFVAVGSFLATSDVAVAQRLFTAQVGAGVALDKDSKRFNGSNFHVTASAEVKPPLTPFGIRTDLMWIDAANGKGIVAATVNGVVAVRLPLVRPYVVAGWGRYGIGDSVSNDGFNAGAGMRVQAGPLRVFAEVRRHWHMSEDLATFGFSLR